MRRSDLRIGIDVGGTNTDAVVLDRDDSVLGWAKTPTTADVTGGIRAALAQVLETVAVDAGRITHVMLARPTRRTRCSSAGGSSASPCCGWALPPRARCRRALVAGGSAACRLRGRGDRRGRLRDRRPRDRAVRPRRRRALPRGRPRDGRGRGDHGRVSPVSAEHELAARELAHEVLGDDIPISLSHEVGSIGLIERENATVLNASLQASRARSRRARAVARRPRARAHRLLRAERRHPDGARLRDPVSRPTIGSGPANPLRGGAFLTGYGDALVADVGGTSTDVGVLVAGFPRESSAATEIGGIRTNFRMPTCSRSRSAAARSCARSTARSCSGRTASASSSRAARSCSAATRRP